MLVDSNILIYSISISSPKHKQAQNFLNSNIREITLAHQNIFETLRVLTHPKYPSPMSSVDAVEAINRIINASRIIAPNYKTHHITLEFIRMYKLNSNNIFDAYLAATAISNDITTIATDNVKDFKSFNIKIINPFTVN